VTSPSQSDLDAIRRMLFGAETARLEQSITELEQRVDRRLDELSQRVTSRLDELARLQGGHAEKVTQLLDQVMSELSRRTDALTAETRAGLEELKAKAAELERRKLNAADFGSSLALLGQRLASSGDETTR
jgi:hypothetical protein